ncbi:cytochrome c oxidase assembly protein [Bailinhaonella thermotolerans]|uniref:Copper resistance protein CopD n=1 Tax=Bailinhaonella thermotolerans TaxID=1070861 RepID=A0A3A4B537_9ACTN|nr:cytochrome c oxidase assembly protein [Bailinhaonella thermotolerans]RJL32542.1 copper resistance protein CopD [Bailinhaonella thermotolerans]
MKVPKLVAGGVLAATAGFVIAFYAGGEATPTLIPGLPDPGPLTHWGLPVTRLAMNALAVLTVGLLLTAAALLPSDKGLLGRSAQAYTMAASWSAAAWAGAAALTLVFTTSEILGEPVTQLSAEELRNTATTASQGVGLTLVVLFALAVAMFARGAITAGMAGGLLVASLVTLLPPPLTGHSSSSPNHGLATTGVALHMVTLALWVGGLLVACYHAWRSAPQLDVVGERFSRMAFWCFIGVGVSGLFSIIARLESPDALVTTDYGRLALAKIVLFGVLGLVGHFHRERTLPRLAQGRPRAFARLAAGETLLMAATVGVAVALARTEPPDIPLSPSAAFELLGYELPPELTVGRLITLWWFDLFFATVAVVLGALYAVGVARLRRRGDRWPWGRTISWFIGLLILVIATQSGVGRYAKVLFSVHMAEHMVLSMLVPIFLVLGAPVTLALRAIRPAARRGDRGPREWITAILHSRAVKVIAHPIVATSVFVVSTYALYFTPLFEGAMEEHVGHLVMSTHFLLSGSLFFWVLIGVDPSPHRIPFIAKLLTLFVTMPFHAFFGIAVMSMGGVIASRWYDQLGRAWGASGLDDQKTGGAIAWGFGEIPTLLVIVALVYQWARDDQRQARNRDRRAEKALAVAAPDDVTTGDSELDDYNEYLAKLNKEGRRPAEQ